MANYAVVVKNTTMSDTNDTLIRNVKAAVDVQNGSLLVMGSPSIVAGEGEVFNVTAPATGALSGLWMAWSPEIVSVISAGGQVYRDINPDPRNFINRAGETFTAFKPQIDDIITISVDGLGGTIAANTNAVATVGTMQPTWGAAITTGLNLKLLNADYISIADGSIGSVTGRTTAYRFVVTSI